MPSFLERLFVNEVSNLYERAEMDFHFSFFLPVLPVPERHIPPAPHPPATFRLPAWPPDHGPGEAVASTGESTHVPFRTSASHRPDTPLSPAIPPPGLAGMKCSRGKFFK
jgi:hypothetical protein